MDRPEFNNALEADAHNWDTRELDRYEAQEVKEIMAVKRNECPCGEPLEYFSGLEEIPSYLFCPKCNDKAWNFDGERIARLE